MKRVKHAVWLAMASVAIVAMMLFSSGSAQLAVKVTTPDGQTHDVTGRNLPRGDEALILYDSAFGESTRTNPYGVEVIAVPAERPVEDGRAYEITQVTSVWACNGDAQKQCGNAEIPPGGVVLSATGSKRDFLKALQPGQLLVLQEDWFHQKQAKVHAVNPTAETNPIGSGFPGFRASNQLLIYDSAYGQPSTGTNEFGFEVTVRNGIVTEQEGSDSTIPPDGFVISGHGQARSWLISHAPLGAKIQYEPATQQLTATVDLDTYLYQFDRHWAQSPCAASVSGALAYGAIEDPACRAIHQRRDEALRLALAGNTGLAASTVLDALEGLKQQVWRKYSAFPVGSVRGAWHRPVEKSRQAIGQKLDMLQEAGLNAVFLETFFHGYTIFPSQTYANYGMTAQNPKFAGVDLLQLWVEEAHKRNMQVHVWFQTFYAGTKAFMPPGPILEKHPEWANVQYSALVPEKQEPNGTAKAVENAMPRLNVPEKPVPSTLELGGYFLDPANPAVKDFLLKLAEEIVTRYDVDGFQLDYIRYPASFPSDRFSYHKTTWGYTKVARNTFKSRYFVDPAQVDPKDPQAGELWKAWQDFKTDQITRFVERMTTSLRQKRPDLKISAAVFPEAENALALKHQDWRTWGRMGWIDFFAPMTLTSAVKVVERDTQAMVAATGGQVPVYSGIFGPFNNNSAEHVLSQVDAARQAGAGGFVLFDTAHLTHRMLQALQVMQAPSQAVAPAQTDVAVPLPVAPVEPAPKEKKRRWWPFGKKR